MMVISPDNRCSMKTVRRELESLLDERQDLDFFPPEPLSPFPPIFKEHDRYKRPATWDPSYSLVTLSNSSIDQRAFEDMNLPSMRGGVHPQDNEENPQASPRSQLVVVDRSDNHEQQNSQTSDGSTRGTKKSSGANRTVAHRENRTRDRLIKLIGRLVPSKIRNRLLVTRNRANTLD